MKTYIFFLLVTLVVASKSEFDLYFSKTAIKQANLERHLNNFQKIAEIYGNNRDARGNGFNASVDYVINEFKDLTTFYTRPVEQHFTYPDSIELIPSEFEWTSNNRKLVQGKDFFGMRRTGNANTMSVNLSKIPNEGCKDEDFKNFQRGDVAHLEMGSCFSSSVFRSIKFGAQAVVLYREGYFGPLTWRETEALTIPIYMISPELNKEFLASANNVVRIKANIKQLDVPSKNLIIESRGGDANNVIVIGAHIDGVDSGPGINDNASGSAGIIEIAKRMVTMARNTPLKNKLRFIWFGAEEVGLLGAYHYVNTIPRTTLRNIRAMINLDMIGSVNYVRFLHDGKTSPEPIREESLELQRVFERYFRLNSQPWDLISTGRSDHFAFIQAGVPSTILSSGFFLKTEDEARRYGGQAGEPHCPCYHQPCDDTTNINYGIAKNIVVASSYVTFNYAYKDFPRRKNLDSIPKGKIQMTDEQFYKIQLEKIRILKQ